MSGGRRLIAASESVWLPSALAAVSALLVLLSLVTHDVWFAAGFALATAFWLHRARVAGCTAAG
jgi:hypothetical protein